MKVRLALALLTLSAPVWAETETEKGFLDVQHQVPKVMIQTDSAGGVVSWPLKSLTSNTLTGFSPGGSNDLIGSEIARIKAIVDGIGPDQYVFIQGRADTTRWYHNYRRKQYEQQDLLLAMTRGQWILELAQKSNPKAAARMYLLAPELVRDGRGVNVFVAIYAPSSILTASQTRRRGMGNDHNDQTPSVRSQLCPLPPRDIGLRMGGGLGLVGVQAADGMTFLVPTLNMDFVKSHTAVSLYAGWRATSETADTLGRRAESVVGGELTLRYWRIGFLAGTNCAWETLRRNDMYLKRAFGFYAGPKLYLVGSPDFNLQTGLNLQETSLNRRGKRESWWHPGYNWSIRAQYILR